MTPRKTSFDPLSPAEPLVLILGSAPGERSLQQQQYYAHPQNAFWKILSPWIQAEPSAPYSERCQALLRSKIAVWDVAQAFEREGSLDSQIRRAVTIPLAGFLQLHPSLKAVLLNGSKAHEIFEKKIWPQLSASQLGLPYFRLPSTSPAYASLRLAQKAEIWNDILARYLTSST